MWSELMNKAMNECMDKDKLQFDVFFEERAWYLAAGAKNLKMKNIREKVVKSMEKRLEERNKKG